MPETDSDGNKIKYTVKQDDVTGYETVYSSDTLTITNSYSGADVSNHSFTHIDVRIAGAQLSIDFVVKDAKGNEISRTSETINCSVIGVNSVILNGKTYTGFYKSGSYEYRKENLNIKVTDSSSATLNVNLQDSDGNIYNNVIVSYGKGGVMDAAYNCNGYDSSKMDPFDGLDFNVGKAQNYEIEYISTGVALNVQKQIQANGDLGNFAGNGGEFTFTLVENETGRSWTASNNKSGIADFAIAYPYSTEAELRAYDGKTYTYTLSETKSEDGYTNVSGNVTFTVSFKVVNTDNGATLTPTLNLNSGAATGSATGVSENATNADSGAATINYVNSVETVDVSGSKTWKDNDNQDGVRPDSITINLLANGEKIDSKTVTANDKWSWTFENLAKYSNGELIKYSIEEEKVEGYEASYSEDSLSVTNTHETEEISIDVQKVWDDSDDLDKLRPSFIKVKLLANGEETDSMLITADNEWKGSFENLPKYSAGNEIEYTVLEDPVNEYEVAITGNSVDGFVITNTHTPKDNPYDPEENEDDPDDPVNPDDPEDSDDPTDSDGSDDTDSTSKSSTKASDSPSTGDEAFLKLYASVMAIAAIMGLAVLGYRRRRESE